MANETIDITELIVAMIFVSVDDIRKWERWKEKRPNWNVKGRVVDYYVKDKQKNAAEAEEFILHSNLFARVMPNTNPSGFIDEVKTSDMKPRYGEWKNPTMRKNKDDDDKRGYFWE